MKPLKLTIAGLHSFTDKQVINFEELCETGLFGIFGPTGSGKSTILDAITLALYGSVERATRGTTGILNSQKDILEVSFTFAIGTNVNRRVYRAERSFKRNKNERDSVRAGICRLIQVSPVETVIADSFEEVNKKIVEIIGLTMTDFTRSVVLPQGEFAKFLKMGDAERVRMLERIFALSEFGMKLIEKVKRERDRLDQELGLTERAIQEQGEISPETIDGMRQELEQLEQQKKALFEEYEQTAATFEQTKYVWELQTELNQLKTDKEKHSANHAVIMAQKKVLEAAEKAEIIRPYLESYIKANNNYMQAREVLEEVLNAYETVEKNHRAIKEQLLQAEKEYREQQPVLIAQKAKLESLVELEQEQIQKEQVLEKLRSEYKEAFDSYTLLEEDIRNGLAEKEKIDAELNENQARIAGFAVSSDFKEKVIKGAVLEREYRNHQEEYEKLTRQLNEELSEQETLKNQLQEFVAERSRLENDIQQVKDELEKLILEKPGDINYYQAKNDELAELEKHINAIALLSAETDKDTAELSQYRRDLQDTESELRLSQERTIEIQNGIDSLVRNRNELRAELELLQEINSAYRLVQNLVDGEPCPVCGSIEHPAPVKIPDNNEIAAKKEELAKLEAAIADKQKEFDSSNQELSKHRTVLAEKQNQLLKLQARINQKTGQIEELRLLLPVEIRENAPDKLQEFAAEEKQKLTGLQQAMNCWENDKHQIQQRFDSIKEKHSAVDSVIKEKEGRLVIVGDNIVKRQDQMAALKLLLDQKEAEYRAAQTEMNISDFQAECDRVLASDRQAEELRAKHEELTNKLNLTVKMIEDWKLKKETIRFRLGEIEFSGKALRDEVAEKRSKIQEVAGDRQLQELIAEITGRLSALNQTVESLKKQHELSLEKLQSSMTARSERMKTVGLYQETMEMARENLEKKLKEKGFSDIAAAREALLTDSERESLRKEITEYEDLDRKFKQAQEALEKKLAGRAVTLEEWNAVQQLKIEIGDRKDFLVEQVARLAHNLEDSQTRYEKILEYRKQQQALARRKALADELLKLLQGDSLVAYIAEEYMHYILKDASARLAMLTNNRYVLRTDSAGGSGKDFIIQDNINGGISRPVSSLSGGETFLVSLSLALALSSQIQLKGVNPLEFFFLDEGFGTLDPRLLEVVMDSLEKLRHENLTVGIISHVAELRNRINRRLVVIPPSVSGTGSQVRIEKN